MDQDYHRRRRRRYAGPKWSRRQRSKLRARRYVNGFNPRWQRNLLVVDNEKWLKDSVVVVSGGNQGQQQSTRWDSSNRGQGWEQEGM